MSEDTKEQGDVSAPFRFRDHIKQAGFNITTEHDLTLREYERTKRFMTWHTPPPDDAVIDAIIVPGTSPIIDETGFELRVDAGVTYGNKFPEAKMVVSGMRPDISRATEREKAPGYSEAKEVATAMKEHGYNHTIFLEEEAKHTGQNIVYSLDMLFGKLDDIEQLQSILDTDEKHVLLIACSSYSARRIDLYMKRELKQRGLEEKVSYYIYDAGVAEDQARETGEITTPLTEESRLRKDAMFLREAKGMSTYRQQKQI